MASHQNLVHVDDIEAVVLDQGPLRATRRRLGTAAGAHGIGVSRWQLPPGGRSTPPHVHADEEELHYVLAGSGVSWQDGATYAVAAGDVLLHRCDAEAHTLIAGDDGLDVLMFAEGSRTSLTYLPRTKQFWAGKRWLPADSTHPFAAEAALSPLDVPPATAPRPATVAHVEDVAPEAYAEPGYEGSERNLGAHLGRRHVGLRHTTIAPGAMSCPPHWHQAEEECFYVLDGEGEALVGDEVLPLRPGSLLVRPPGTGVAHALRAGAAGMTYLAFGTHRPDELVYYPRSKKILVGGGVVFEVESVDYWKGEL